jgi:photosystem II stability/assembly factor-like uncharacterized protein
MPITVRHRERLSLIAVAVVAATLAGCSSPAYVPSSGVKNPSGTKLTPPLDLFNISLADPLHGWALAVEGAPKRLRVLKTKDGGSNWELATPPQLGDLEANGAYGLFPGLRPEESWLIVNTRANGTLLLRTSDGGGTWSKSSLPLDTQSGCSLFLLDDHHAWVMAHHAGMGHDYVTLLSTQDGGSTWEILPPADPGSPVPSSLPSPGGKSGPVFLDTHHGWIGSGPSTKGQGHLYATNDGGKSWHEQALALPATTAAAGVKVSAPRFFSPTVGVIDVEWYGNDGTGGLIIFQTADGGATWQGKTPFLFGPEMTHPVQVAFSDSQDGFAWVPDPGDHHSRPMYRTTDGGQRWEPWDPGFPGAVDEIPFAREAVGWATVAANDQGSRLLFVTHDQGATWVRLYPPVTPR